jgi:alanine racemase
MVLFSSLASICNGKILQQNREREVRDLLIDSRKTLLSDQTLFFAISGDRHDGHQFIPDLYAAGIRQFVVEHPVSVDQYQEANIILVDSSRTALQALAEAHRKNFTIPIIGITGSNGKTIIKEWLFQLLSPDYKVVKNPGSYNSQVGVPLSIWQIQNHHQLGVFEAGISRPTEMERLAKIIRPTLGIFSNLGSAHDEGFVSQVEKVREKLKLFNEVEALIYCSDNALLKSEIQQSKIPAISWGFKGGGDYLLQQQINRITLKDKKGEFSLTLPFTDKASVENALHCIILMHHLKYSPSSIQERITVLHAVPMRLELKRGINNCQIIDDSYNNDLGGLQISLDFLGGLQKKKKTLILSDILQTGLEDSDLVSKIQDMLVRSGVQQLIAIGPVLHEYRTQFLSKEVKSSFYKTTEEALDKISWEEFNREVILIKGARLFQFERIVARLQRRIHGTRMEIDLDKMAHNLNYFKSRLNPGVKVMVMVKAFAYGSGSEEVANLLQYHRVDYLGVAYTDEGVDLRKNQISLPIMVMNPTEESFPLLLTNRLEPTLYSIGLLKSLIEFLQGQSCIVHLELETGMHRLGLEKDDLEEIIALLKANPNISVASIFSHLAGADESKHDTYSQVQFESFQNGYKKITAALRIQPIRHILNSSGILRLPNLQMDMVRLGIGLYGVNPTSDSNDQLQPVATLKTVISQIKKLKARQSVGYGRRGQPDSDMTLATIAIGYADGFSRSFSRGAGRVMVAGKRVPVVGNVCMDMTMIDITGINVHEGDDVIIFGEGMPIQEVAASINTIPYEILTNTSERVKRVFFAGSY